MRQMRISCVFLEHTHNAYLKTIRVQLAKKSYYFHHLAGLSGSGEFNLLTSTGGGLS